MKIYFDMDGTIANFYKGEWLNDLINENPRPYRVADVLVSEEILLGLIKKGYELCIVSWLSRGGSVEFGKEVRKVKKEWLKVNYPNVRFEEIHIVKYGTPKYSVVKDRNGILVDDEEHNRNEWKGQSIEPKEIYNF